MVGLPLIDPDQAELKSIRRDWLAITFKSYQQLYCSFSVVLTKKSGHHSWENEQ